MRDGQSGILGNGGMMTNDSRDLAWIRERLDYGNLAYHERELDALAAVWIRELERKPTHMPDCFRDPFMGPDPACPACVPDEETGPTVPCPKCGEPMLDDGVFETCGYCAEGE